MFEKYKKNVQNKYTKIFGRKKQKFFFVKQKHKIFGRIKTKKCLINKNTKCMKKIKNRTNYYYHF